MPEGVFPVNGGFPGTTGKLKSKRGKLHREYGERIRGTRSNKNNSLEQLRKPGGKLKKRGVNLVARWGGSIKNVPMRFKAALP